MMKNEGNSMGIHVPDFFRVYLPEFCEDHMDFPTDFNRFLANPLPKNVIIRSRSKNVWTIAMRRIKGKVRLKDGWKKFVKDNDLKLGEFLVFKYDGSRVFEVSIYDHSACEEIRPSTNNGEIKEDGEEVEEEEDEEEEEEEEEEDNDDDINEQEEEEDADDDDAEDGEGMETKEMKTLGKKKSSGCRGSSSKAQENSVEGFQDKDRLRKYLDNPMNPSFAAKLTNKRNVELRIPKLVIKDYDLKFPELITLIDPLGKLVRKTADWGDRRVCVKGFGSIINRNWVRPKDQIICELLREADGWVRAIKVHILRG